MDNHSVPVRVKRHRTAISRQEFSRPVKALLAHRMIDQSTRLFDFGCGLGDDVRSLKELGFEAAGWDPVYFPDEPVKEADAVNLGYVLNVIEDVAEREETLRAAYSLARKVLCVAVIVGASDYEGRSIPYGDGVVTRKETFQKYFEQDELSSFIEHCVGVSAVAVAPGIFFVFRDVAIQNEFLLGRLHRREIPTARGLPVASRPSRQSALVLEFKKNEENKWKEYEAFVKEYGRPPTLEESVVPSVARTYGIHDSELFKAIQDEIGEEAIGRAAEARRNELIVFLAISYFRHIPKLKELPQTMRQSIRFYFGALDNALIASKERLMLVGNQEEVRKAAEAQALGLNTFDGYFVATQGIDLLPPILQILIRMSELFYGDLSTTDIIKIHKNSPKISLFIFRDFESAARPTLKTRIKIDLREQKIRVFDHSSSDNPEVLVGKDLLFNIQNLQNNSKDRELISRLIELRLPFGTVVRTSIVKRLEE